MINKIDLTTITKTLQSDETSIISSHMYMEDFKQRGIDINHLNLKFGLRYIDDIVVIQPYFAETQIFFLK